MDQYGGYPTHHPLSYPPYVAARPVPHAPHPLHLRPGAVPNYPVVVAGAVPSYARPPTTNVPSFPVVYANPVTQPHPLHGAPTQPINNTTPVNTTMAPSASPLDSKTTVYVGKIAPSVEDDFVRRLLEKCGPVSNWKRVVDPVTEALSAFGFCEFAHPDGAIRALLLLSNASIDGQQLLLKVNEKTQKQLDEYKRSRSEDKEYLENTMQSDDDVKSEILQMLSERRKGRSINGEDDQDAEQQITRELKMVRERQSHQKESENSKKDDERDRERELRKERERERTRIREQREREREREARRREREEREFKERERDWENREREKDKERERREKIDLDHVEDMDERRRRQRARERKREKDEDDYDREKEEEEIKQQMALQQKQEQAQRKLQPNDDQKKDYSVPNLLTPGGNQHLFGSPNDLTSNSESKSQHGFGFGLAAAAASLVKRRKLASTAIGQVVEEEEEPELVPRKKRALVTLENEAATHDNTFDSSNPLSSSTSTLNEPKLSAEDAKKNHREHSS
eukprot:TRINITY_DN8121_c0_g2_i1.p1 TRINITY_DN8121_c0_g2~~TRINITY_DN8121_c0_g2_i1.p1  ORF type:complete len:561 (-),score=148.95 TRINITY_DN8121_c0_g2_i1:410-1963(-)